MERWKKVKGYGEAYSISTNGRIRNDITGYISYGTNNGNGYKRKTLSHNGEHERKYIHRLVAEAFLENPNGLTEVNHIDGNRGNNHVSNLEWVSSSGNTEHAVRRGALVPWNRKRKPIIATNLETGEETYFISISKAEVYYGTRHIDSVLSGKRNSAKGHTFRYAAEGGDANVNTGSLDIREA